MHLKLLHLAGSVALLFWAARMVRTGIERNHVSMMLRALGRSGSSRLGVEGIRVGIDFGEDVHEELRVVHWRISPPTLSVLGTLVSLTLLRLAKVLPDQNLEFSEAVWPELRYLHHPVVANMHLALIVHVSRIGNSPPIAPRIRANARNGARQHEEHLQSGVQRSIETSDLLETLRALKSINPMFAFVPLSISPAAPTYFTAGPWLGPTELFAWKGHGGAVGICKVPDDSAIKAGQPLLPIHGNPSSCPAGDRTLPHHLVVISSATRRLSHWREFP